MSSLLFRNMWWILIACCEIFLVSRQVITNSYAKILLYFREFSYAPVETVVNKVNKTREEVKLSLIIIIRSTIHISTGWRGARRTVIQLKNFTFQESSRLTRDEFFFKNKSRTLEKNKTLFWKTFIQKPLQTVERKKTDYISTG